MKSLQERICRTRSPMFSTIVGHVQSLSNLSVRRWLGSYSFFHPCFALVLHVCPPRPVSIILMFFGLGQFVVSSNGIRLGAPSGFVSKISSIHCSPCVWLRSRSSNTHGHCFHVDLKSAHAVYLVDSSSRRKPAHVEFLFLSAANPWLSLTALKQWTLCIVYSSESSRKDECERMLPKAMHSSYLSSHVLFCHSFCGRKIRANLCFILCGWNVTEFGNLPSEDFVTFTSNSISLSTMSVLCRV